MSEIILPKVYEDRNGLFPQHVGKPKGSYSQFSSYNDPEYQPDYYVQYFLGQRLPGGEFAEFGSTVGETIEQLGQNQVVTTDITPEDLEIIKGLVSFPDNCVYEDEVCVDFGDFVMEGYVDRSEYFETEKVKSVGILDFKTGNLQKKAEYYKSEDYKQTDLYCLQKQREGYEIKYSGVHMLGRKGSSLAGKGNFKMRLQGADEKINLPFTKVRATAVVKKMTETAKAISDDYKIYLKYFS